MKVTAKVAKEAAKFNVALEHQPEFAAQIGILISLFAIVEEYVPHLVAKLTGMPHADAYTIVNAYQSFSYRIDLLSELIKNRDHKQDVSSYAHFVGALNTANTLRNKYAHARYSIGRDGKDQWEVIVQTFPTALKKKPKNYHMKVKGIEADVKQMKLIICDLHAFTERNELPVTS